MYRHVDVIEATRQQSEGFLHNLQHKLNVLQDVSDEMIQLVTPTFQTVFHF